ncbi:hypothetical protein W97_00312 [Coniosporium apollinis CBS 100218]|uniref:Phospholipid/glycerol acyltransferase domain-containing protein n=1 Tax=Coniosporium apollinis (strain CBS 100218) TaxID=1168221 RepID=R7YHL1_CONA1|nr:uncharacterized protein W97_00312 [Coniosporium apollinis CBS 100218]EON61101.1 hypothetical protein W97_00312 [Coniosporium apollinis CBS 100218]
MASPKTPSPSAPDISILGDQVTLHPTGYEEPTGRTQDGGEQEQNLISGFSRFRSSPFDFLREISLHVSGTGWRSYDHAVGQPIFHAGFSENMKSAVMGTPMLQAKIRELAERRVKMEEGEGLLPSGEGEMREKRRKEIEGALQEVAEKMVDDMICKMESIHVSSEEVLRLRSVAEKAAKSKHSIIFLPCHKSHVDYVSLQIICYRLGLALPTVVAGDNLNIPLLGSFLQHAGAMWIRRSFGDDQLYQTVVQSYIDTLLQNGYNFECFVEGGRSRTGKLLPPRFGILSFLLDSVLSGRVSDAIVCPVSTQYDKVIEVDSYISELLGQPKPKENLRDFLSASSVLSLKLGRVDVRFHEPWSLRAFIQTQQDRFSAPIPARITAPQPPQQTDIKVRLLRTLGYKVLSDINAVSVIMPTALIGTVLLTLRGRGVGRSELIRRVDQLSARVRSRGGRVAHFASQPTSLVVARGLEVLGPDLVGTVPGLPEETYYAVDRFQLSFYRNMTIHLFVLPSLVCAALYTRVKLGGPAEHQRVERGELRQKVRFLSQLFRGEFIFPTEGLEANLERTIEGLRVEGVVEVSDAEDGSEFVELSEQERDGGRENFDFYCFLIWPFVEASWLGAVSLLMLTPPPPPPPSQTLLGDARLTAAAAASNPPLSPPRTTLPHLDQNKVHNRAQLLGKTLYHQGDLSYFEAVNISTLKNAYTQFEEEGIIVVAKTKAGPATLRLAEEWMPERGGNSNGGAGAGNGNGNGSEDGAPGRILPRGKLWEFAETISQFRREGKNRRDGRTVVSRVLTLVDVVGRGLWEEAAASAAASAPALGAAEAGAQTDAEDEKPGKRKKKRRKTLETRARL